MKNAPRDSNQMQRIPKDRPKSSASTRKPPPIIPVENKNGHATSSLELQYMLHALQAMRAGDFSVRMPGDQVGIVGKISDTFNEIVAANQRMAQQLERVGQVVGREGQTRHRVKFGQSSG